jgi:hypothetical protein
VHLQRTGTGEDTLIAKRAFEAFAQSHGVKIKHYHCDNGRFADKSFIDHVQLKSQSLSYCGVNAHFQNALAEKRIRDLQDATRTMLVHAKHRWPAAITPHLWPHALRLANDIHMNTPLSSGKAPIELFSQIASATDPKHFHPFGCPVYALSDRMQGGGKGPKWEERARVSIHLGNSPVHSRNVCLVLNVETGTVSPQFHVKYDDLFETVRDLTHLNIQWQSRTGFIPASSAKPSAPPSPDPISLPPTTYRETTTNPFADQPEFLDYPWAYASDKVMQSPEGASPESTPGSVPVAHDFTSDEGHHNRQNSLPDAGDRSTMPEHRSVIHEQRSEVSSIMPEQRSTTPEHSSRVQPAAAPTSAPTEVRTRTRTIRPPDRFRNDIAFMAQAWDDVWDIEDFEIQEQMADPIAFAATSNPDTMYLHQALRAPDREEFIKAMKQEIKDHEDLQHWELVPKSELPQDMIILPAVWSMKRKRRIDTREVYRWKARLNVHGGKQVKDIHYWETYSPVVKWSSIRLFLTLAVVKGWHMRQVDFVLAYPQADIETELFMEVPQGFEFQGSRNTHCLRLLKNLYGQKQAGRVWNKHLHKGLMEMGFTQSKIDECVYYRNSTIFLCYVDDSVLIDPDAENINKVFAEFKALKYGVTDEGQIDDYLGVKIERRTDGTIKLSQPHLIDQILDDLNLLHSDETSKYQPKSQDTPANTTTILDRDVDGEPHDQKWSYRSVIGKLNFLEKSSRPDLAYAVHNAARFSSDPKASHSKAVKRIGRYLLGTKDKGIIMRPDMSRSIEVYADADFCGLFDPETALYDPVTAKSRTGYVITYMGCPITWASKLQGETALSTTEAEYGSLLRSPSQCSSYHGLTRRGSLAQH